MPSSYDPESSEVDPPAPLSLENSADELVKWITEKAILGVPPLSSAVELADQYTSEDRYTSADECVDALIKWESSKNFAAGFVTGLGGVMTMPVAIPAAVGASWVLQARMAAAIARIYGHHIQDDKVRTFVLLTLLGGEAIEVLREVGVRVGNKVTMEFVKRIPGKILISINKRVGFRLLTKAGQTGVVNLTKLVPIAGGLIGGTVDLLACQAVGRIAKSVFRVTPDDGEPPDYKVFYSFGDGKFELGGEEAIPINITEEYPAFLAQLTVRGDFFGIIDGEGNTLQMKYDPEDKTFWVEVPISEECGSFGCEMSLDQVIDLMEMLPRRFTPDILPDAEFVRWRA